jgi:hypothetical protein
VPRPGRPTRDATGGDDDAPSVRVPDAFLRTCERACNDRYMSLDPIPLSEMVQWNGTA